MGTCDHCGNEYDKTFDVRTSSGQAHTFDSLECAAQLIARTCAQCGCRILGHGVEADDRMFCCAHCAKAAGRQELVDRV